MHLVPDDPHRTAGPDELISDFPRYEEDPMDAYKAMLEMEDAERSITDDVLRIKSLADRIAGPQTADRVPVSSPLSGTQFRINDPQNPHNGKLACLVFNLGGVAWMKLLVDGKAVVTDVRLENLLVEA